MPTATGYRVLQSFTDGRGCTFPNGMVLPVGLVDAWKTKLARLEARMIEPIFDRDDEPSPPPLPSPKAGPVSTEPVVAEGGGSDACVCPVCGEKKQSARAVKIHMGIKHQQEVSS